jgi:hypothetical protein
MRSLTVTDQTPEPLTDGALRLIAGVAAIGTPPPADTAHRIARELIAARDKLARVTAMVDHGLHSEDPDEHDCANRPCWAVMLRSALGIEEVGGE